MTSREEVDGPDKDAEQDNDVSDWDEDIDRDAIRGGGGSEAEKCESGRSDRDKKY